MSCAELELEFVDVDSCADPCHDFLIRNRPATHRPFEIVDESPPRCRVVKRRADARRLRGLGDEVLETRARRVETFNEERERRRVAAHELRWMQIPSLIESGCHRVTNVFAVNAPGRVNGATV